MPRQLPGYLSTLPPPSRLVPYIWDHSDIEAVEEPLDAELIASLETLPRRAILAYAIGSAEWLVHRLAPLLPDNAPWSFLEATWAMLVDFHYSNYGDSMGWTEYAEGPWAGAIKGPVKGPINRALMVVESAILEVHWRSGSDAQYVATAAAQVHKLTRHVLDDPRPYCAWSDQVIARLKALYPLVMGDNLGEVVPPEALDPSRPFEPHCTEQSVNAHLATLDYMANPFLSPPAAMKEVIEDDACFEGNPYVFDIEADRVKRRTRRG